MLQWCLLHPVMTTLVIIFGIWGATYITAIIAAAIVGLKEKRGPK